MNRETNEMKQAISIMDVRCNEEMRAAMLNHESNIADLMSTYDRSVADLMRENASLKKTISDGVKVVEEMKEQVIAVERRRREENGRLQETVTKLLEEKAVLETVIEKRI